MVPETILNKQANTAVQNLLQQCKNLKNQNFNQELFTNSALLQKGIVSPFENSGMNSELKQGFRGISFTITNDPKSKGDFSIVPKYVQIQAAIYLGCRRISCFSYSKLSAFGNDIDFGDEFLKFYKPRITKVLEKQTEIAEDVLKMEAYGE